MCEVNGVKLEKEYFQQFTKLKNQYPEEIDRDVNKLSAAQCTADSATGDNERIYHVYMLQMTKMIAG